MSGDDVYVVGVGATPVGRLYDRTFESLVGEAVMDVLADAGMTNGEEIGSAWFSNVLMDFFGQPAGKGAACLTPLMNDGVLPAVPIGNVEGGCASGSLALISAVRDIQAGVTDCALAVGVEKMNAPDGRNFLGHMVNALDQLNPAAWAALYEETAADVGAAWDRGADRSMLMDLYALWAKTHMARYGTTVEQIAASAAKNHTAAVGNPRAQYRFAMTVDEVLSDRVVSDPLTRAMCAPTGDGAAAAIVCSSSHLKTLPGEVRDRALRVLGTGLAGGTYRADWETERAPVGAARQAYKQAGLAPDALDVIELHDASSFAEIHLVEDLGLAPRGEGGPFTASGATTLEGTIPVNPSGGLVSRGHPLGATGLLMIRELALQLRGEAGEIQVPKAKIGLAENGGGVVGNDVALCAVIILGARRTVRTSPWQAGHSAVVACCRRSFGAEQLWDTPSSGSAVLGSAIRMPAAPELHAAVVP